MMPRTPLAASLRSGCVRWLDFMIMGLPSALDWAVRCGPGHGAESTIAIASGVAPWHRKLAHLPCAVFHETGTLGHQRSGPPRFPRAPRGDGRSRRCSSARCAASSTCAGSTSGTRARCSAPGDFVTRTLCGRPGHPLPRQPANACACSSTSAATAARWCAASAAATRSGYTCFYHGWSYDRDGSLDGVPGESSYPASFDRKRVRPRAAAARRLATAASCSSRSTRTRCRSRTTSPARRNTSISSSTSRPRARWRSSAARRNTTIRANWKLLVENSFDDYHLHEHAQDVARLHEEVGRRDPEARRRAT